MSDSTNPEADGEDVDPTPIDGGTASADEAERPEPPPEPDPLETALAEAKKLKDQLLRTAADFDNFRKRSVRENREAEIRGRENLLKDILPVFDNLERAVAHAQNATDVASLLEGIRMVTRQFGDTLERMDIHRVPAAGVPFDPALHEAIQQMPSSDHPPGTIVAEVLAGYRLGQKLIRPAMVVVATEPSENDEAPGDAGDAGETPETPENTPSDDPSGGS